MAFEAPNAVTVGVAALLPSDTGEPIWQPVGFDADASDGFQIDWKLSKDLMDEGARSTPVVYTVCWGGNVPGRTYEHSDLNALLTGSAPVEISPQQIRQGASTACLQGAGGS